MNQNQCVPSWDLEEPPYPPSHVPTSEYEVAELTWGNRQPAVHVFGQYPTISKPKPKYPSVSPSDFAWEKPPPTGMLESVIEQLLPNAVADALVPDPSSGLGGKKRAKVAEGAVSQGSVAPVATMDTLELNTSTEDAGFGATGSASDPPSDDRDCSYDDSMKYQAEDKGRTDETGRTSLSTRGRAAAIHNQSERRRRDRINEKMKILQKLVPNSSKTDKASMLEEVIEYLKQLKAQVQMMSRIFPHLVMPTPMQQQQQQLQMAMMAHHMAQMTQMSQIAQMGFGLGSMGMAPLGGHGSPGMPPVLLPPFLPYTAARLIRHPGGGDGILPDSSAFLAYSMQQPMDMGAYNKMASIYQQLCQQPSAANPSN